MFSKKGKTARGGGKGGAPGGKPPPAAEREPERELTRPGACREAPHVSPLGPPTPRVNQVYCEVVDLRWMNDAMTVVQFKAKFRMPVDQGAIRPLPP